MLRTNHIWYIHFIKEIVILFITTWKRSLRRLCFYRCLSVHMGGHALLLGGHAWLPEGGMCVVVVEGWGHACFFGGACMGGACVVFLGGIHVFWGGMHGFFRGACMVFWGGVCGFLGGCACFFWGNMHGFLGERAWFFRGVHRIQWDTVNEWVVRILLECILVYLWIKAIFCVVIKPMTVHG